MWAIKFLSGSLAGQEVRLQKGLMVLGKESSCQIPLPSEPGISKKHAQITIRDENILIEDLDSRNGIYVDGKQVYTRLLKEGDRVALGNIIFEVRKKSESPSFPHPYMSPYPPVQPTDEAQNTDSKEKATAEKNLSGIQQKATNYLHNVVLPGVYKLAEWVEFKWVVGMFVIGFIFLVTFFSSFPLIQILKSSVEQESLNNAENIAVTLKKLNRPHLQKGLETALSISYAKRRPGVKEAFIINAVSGRVLAPAELAHSYPKTPFIHKARKLDKITVEKIDSSTVAAMVPIRFYDPKTGENNPMAYSVVIYDMGALAKGNAQTVSLMFQNLFIACVLGFIIFFFLINLIEFPIKSINRQLNQSLKDDRTPPVSVNYQSSVLSALCSNINSALNRISLSQALNEEDEFNDVDVDNRQNEMNNLVEIIGFPSLSVDLQNDTIASVNSNWTDQIGIEDILHSSLQNVSEESLKTELGNLIEQGRANPQEISFGEIYLKGARLQTTCQFVMGAGEPAYAIVTFMPDEKEAA